MLNYLTLNIRDEEIALNLQKHKLENFRRLSLPVLAISSIMFLFNLVQRFLIHKSDNISLILSATILAGMIWLYFFQRHTPRFLPEVVSSTFLIHSIVVNLVYRDQVADTLKSENKTQFDFILILIFIITSSINQGSLKFTTFVMFPAFALATYFQQLAITTIQL